MNIYNLTPFNLNEVSESRENSLDKNSLLQIKLKANITF